MLSKVSEYSATSHWESQMQGGGPWGPFCTLCMRHSLPPGTCRETGALTGSHGLSVNFKKLWFLTLKRFLFCFVFVKSLDI